MKGRKRGLGRMPEMVVTGRMQDAMRDVLARTQGVSSEEMSLLVRHNPWRSARRRKGADFY